MKKLFLLLLLVVSCGDTVVRPTYLHELSSVTWAEVTEDSYSNLIDFPSVMGKQENGKYFLLLVTWERN